MQGTIKEWDDAGRAGTLITDDRTEYTIDSASVDRLVRTLRPGQRVTFEAGGSGDRPVALGLRLITFES
jgi:cold shock CspA family protein